MSDGRHPRVSLGQVSAFIRVKMLTSDSMPHSSESLLYQLHASHKNKCDWQAIEGCQGQIFRLVCVASSKPSLHLTRSDVVPETNQPCCTPGLSANAQDFYSGETNAELMKKKSRPPRKKQHLHWDTGSYLIRTVRTSFRHKGELKLRIFLKRKHLCWEH